MKANPRPSAPPPPGQTAGRGGFTLMELIVVMAIGAIIFGLAVGTFSGTGPLRCEGAAKSAAALFDEARQWAVSTGSSVRLLVHQDPAEPDRIGRYLALVRSAPVSPPEGAEAEETGDLWIVGSTVKFDEGIFFSPDDVGDKNPPEPFRVALSGEGSVGGDGTLWTPFQFSPRGVCEQEGAQFVFRPGVYDGATPIRSEEAEFSGFTIQRTGKALFFEPFDTLPKSSEP